MDPVPGHVHLLLAQAHPVEKPLTSLAVAASTSSIVLVLCLCEGSRAIVVSSEAWAD